MKKIFSKKYLLIYFLVLIFFVGTVVAVLATGQDLDHYRANKAKSNVGEVTNIVTKIGASTIINRSDKDFFVPNNTAPEYTAWAQNAPNYVEVSVCGDGVCGEGEPETCKDDCPVYESYCGDGICKQSGNLVRVNYPTPRTVTYDLRYCDFYRNKWMYVPIVNIFVFCHWEWDWYENKL